jgi:tetratricopeptide (TPR) repeat protein
MLTPFVGSFVGSFVGFLVPRAQTFRTPPGLNPARARAIRRGMADAPTLQERYDDAMFDFSQANYDLCIEKLTALLAEDPAHFDAQLSLGMAWYRKGDYPRAIAEGHKAEQLRPKEQLAHTNLSLFYMKAGDKATAEHHGLQARIASWRDNMAPPAAGPSGDPELQMAQPKAPPMKLPSKFPDMPWKKKPGTGGTP